MGQNGAATSGRGLTGVQIVSSIRMVAAMHEKCTNECSVEGNPVVQNSSSCGCPQSSQTDVEVRFSQFPKEAYTERHAHRFIIEGKEVEVSEYAPRVFCLIRSMNCINNTKYVDEWTLPPGHHKMSLSTGRSQAFFIKSKNMLFLSKTIAKEEFEAVADILMSYTQYLSVHPNSLLSRFYMLLSMRIGKKVGYILCTSDVFSHASSLHEKWDIKGRMPKLGRFFYIPHLVPHTYDPNMTQGDDPGIEKGAINGSNIEQSGLAGKQGVATKHDKDLTRMFWIKKEHRDRLIRQLLSDYLYLSSVNLMDYSLLIGVSRNSCNSLRLGQEDATCDSFSWVQSNSSRVDLSKVTTCALDSQDPTVRRGQYTASKYEKGIPSVLGGEVYYIGIIDVLTRYTIKKKLANFFKSFIWSQKSLSTIPPKSYQRRINKYTQIIFPEVH